VTVGTTYWKLVAEQRLKQVSCIKWRQLPENVIALVKNVMTDYSDVSDDNKINIRFNKDSNTTVCDSDLKVTSLTRVFNTDITDKVRNLTESLRH
jgi:hypothetical protein